MQVGAQSTDNFEAVEFFLRLRSLLTTSKVRKVSGAGLSDISLDESNDATEADHMVPVIDGEINKNVIAMNGADELMEEDGEVSEGGNFGDAYTTSGSSDATEEFVFSRITDLDYSDALIAAEEATRIAALPLPHFPALRVAQVLFRLGTRVGPKLHGEVVFPMQQLAAEMAQLSTSKAAHLFFAPTSYADAHFAGLKKTADNGESRRREALLAQYEALVVLKNTIITRYLSTASKLRVVYAAATGPLARPASAADRAESERLMVQAKATWSWITSSLSLADQKFATASQMCLHMSAPGGPLDQALQARSSAGMPGGPLALSLQAHSRAIVDMAIESGAVGQAVEEAAAVTAKREQVTGAANVIKAMAINTAD